MSDAEFDISDLSRLSQMLADGIARPWRPEEMGAILRHQLSAQLKTDLAAAGEPVGEPAASHMTFAELLHHPHPPLEMLRRVKRFAKACNLAGGDGPLPPEVAKVLYFASIIVARLRCGQQISALDDDALRQAGEWARAQQWLDEPTRSIFEEAAAKWAATG